MSTSGQTLEPEAAIVGTPRSSLSRSGGVRFRLAPRLAVGLGIVAFYIVVAALAPVLAPHDPLAQDIIGKLARPGPHHLLGTDQLGRDVLSRIIYGARIDLIAASVAAFCACAIGSLVGLVSGYTGGWIDAALTRLMDMVQTIPEFTLMLVLLLVLGPGVVSLVIALAVTHWIAYARLIRGSVLVLRDQDFVAAARLAGLRTSRILLRHLLPNVGRQAITYLASNIVLGITAIASLGYLGIGVQPPTPEWGALIADGQDFLASNWWLSVAPGVVVVALGLGLALVADGLTDGRRRG